MEPLVESVPCLLGEIDGYIATDYQVKPGVKRIRDQVVPPEVNGLLEPVAYPVRSSSAGEVLLQNGLWNVLPRVRTIRSAIAGPTQRHLIHIGGHNPAALARADSVQDERHGVGLAPGRTASTPDIQATASCRQSRLDQGLKLFKGRWIAEELGDLDGQIRHQFAQFEIVLLEHAKIAGDARRRRARDKPAQTAPHLPFSIAAQVYPCQVLHPRLEIGIISVIHYRVFLCSPAGSMHISTICRDISDNGTTLSALPDSPTLLGIP